VELFCIDCKVNVCLLCSVVEHDGHKRREISDFVAEFTEQMDMDMKKVESLTASVQKQAKCVNDKRFKFLKQVEATEAAIVNRGEEIKRLVDKQVGELQQELQAIKAKTCKEMEQLREKLELKITSMGGFGAYWTGLKAKGKPSDITRAANDLHNRATGLLQKDVPENPAEYQPPTVKFLPLTFGEIASGRVNLIGSLLTTTPAGEFNYK